MYDIRYSPCGRCIAERGSLTRLRRQHTCGRGVGFPGYGLMRLPKRGTCVASQVSAWNSSSASTNAMTAHRKIHGTKRSNNGRDFSPKKSAITVGPIKTPQTFIRAMNQFRIRPRSFGRSSSLSMASACFTDPDFSFSSSSLARSIIRASLAAVVAIITAAAVNMNNGATTNYMACRMKNEVIALSKQNCPFSRFAMEGRCSCSCLVSHIMPAITFRGVLSCVTRCFV